MDYQQEESSGPSALECQWNFGDASPKNLYLSTSGTIVYKVSLVVITALNGDAPRICIGTSSYAEALMAYTDNAPHQAGTYETVPGKLYTVDTQITLTIDPSTSTEGNGMVIINYGHQ
jgi:hypothetical protein